MLAELEARGTAVASGLRAPVDAASTPAQLHDAAAVLRDLHMGSAALDDPPARSAVTATLLAAADDLLARLGTTEVARRLPERAVGQAASLRADLAAVTVDAAGRSHTAQWRGGWFDTADRLDRLADGVAALDAPPTRASHPVAQAVARARAGAAALGAPSATTDARVAIAATDARTTSAATDARAAIAQLTPVLADLAAAAPVHLEAAPVRALHAEAVAEVDAAVRPHLAEVARGLTGGGGRGDAGATMSSGGRDAGSTLSDGSGDAGNALSNRKRTRAAETAAGEASVDEATAAGAAAQASGSFDPLTRSVLRPFGAIAGAVAADVTRPVADAASALRAAGRELDRLDTPQGRAVRATFARHAAPDPFDAAEVPARRATQPHGVMEPRATPTSAGAAGAHANAIAELRGLAADVDEVGDLLAAAPTSVVTPVATSRAADLATTAIAARLADAAPTIDAATVPSARADLAAARRVLAAAGQAEGAAPAIAAPAANDVGATATAQAVPRTTLRSSRATADHLRASAARSELVARRAGATDPAASIAAARAAFARAAQTAPDFTRLTDTTPAWRAGTDAIEAAWVAGRADLPAPVEHAVGGRIAAFDGQLRAAEAALSTRPATADRIAESSFPRLALAARLRQDVETLDLVQQSAARDAAI